MTFDKPEHKELVMQLINVGNFPGKLVELVLDLKQAVMKAEVKPPNKQEE